jgi:microcystin-dependent protein
MATAQYRDPSDGQFKELPLGSVGPPGPTGTTGPTGADAGGPPAGSIMAYVGTTAPTGWHFCDGTAHGSAALEAMIGTLTPDLRDRFVVGVSASKATLSTGGAATVTLTAAESGLPSHTHTATDAHIHSFNPSSTASASALSTHTHPITGYAFGLVLDAFPKGADGGDNNYHRVTSHSDASNSTTSAHTHAVNIPSATSVATSPAVTIDAAGAANATAAHENLPPFYALAYVIRTV